MIIKTLLLSKTIDPELKYTKKSPNLYHNSNSNNIVLVHGGFSRPNHLWSMERARYIEQPSPLQLF